MSEESHDLRGIDRDETYRTLAGTVESVLAGVRDRYAAMATFAALLHHGFGHLWTGFYVVASPAVLRVGPYQGTLGCLEIAFGRGVCGTAAQSRKTVVVDDVHAFAGHITCDARSRSEIVVPVFDRHGALIAVLDVDSAELARFDARDVAGLERLVGWFARHDLLPVHAEGKPAPLEGAGLPRLLVVDDEQGILNAVRGMLRLHYQVTIMADGLEALALLEGGAEFDLVLTDMMMPGITGKQLYERATVARPDLAERFFFASGGGGAKGGDARVSAALRRPVCRQAVRDRAGRRGARRGLRHARCIRAEERRHRLTQREQTEGFAQ